jgi:neopullulanase
MRPLARFFLYLYPVRMKHLYLSICVLCASALAIAGKEGKSAQQKILSAVPIVRVDPPNWWVGMQDTTLQLCVYGKAINSQSVVINYPGVTMTKVTKVKNPNYLFLDLSISRTAPAGKIEFSFSDSTHCITHNFWLRTRDSLPRAQGFSSADLMYLLMPDRFSNGEKRNDIVSNMTDTKLKRDSMFYRHGGDLKGLIDHLPYIHDLGATALWLTPVVENNQPKESYHGYACTDHYKVDARLGNIEQYTEMVALSHQLGMKVVMDVVYNHVGNECWFIKDPPEDDWIHRTDTFVKTNYRATALIDPYASQNDRDRMRDGWFDKHMPDLNQRNPRLAKYLTQSTIWWIESTGIDGLRMDTYTYADADFMSQLNLAISREYPHISTVGELWDHGVAVESYFMQHPKVMGVPETNLQGLTDFQMYYAMNEAFSKPMDWTGGLAKIYYTLVQDYLYDNPMRNVTFLDNHDLSRFYSVVGEDIRKYKMGIACLLTMRGIPCLYYGTEILMKNYAAPDGKVREDFIGGWHSDKRSKFKSMGRTSAENEAFDFVTKLAQYRKTSEALQSGKLTQFVPENNTYVYFRSSGAKTLMMIYHYDDKESVLDMSRFAEILTSHQGYKDVMTDKDDVLPKEMTLSPYSVRVLELK